MGFVPWTSPKKTGPYEYDPGKKLPVRRQRAHILTGEGELLAICYKRQLRCTVTEGEVAAKREVGHQPHDRLP